MIILNYPKTSEAYYALLGSYLHGPLDTTGAINSSPIEWDEFGDFRQMGGILGEHGVEHVSFSGSVDYRPWILTPTLSPTTTYPDRISVPWNMNTSIYANLGFANVGVTSLIVSGSNYYQYNPIIADQRGLSYYTITFNATTNYLGKKTTKVIAAELVEVVPVSKNGSTWNWTTTTTSYTLYANWPIVGDIASIRQTQGALIGYYNQLISLGATRRVVTSTSARNFTTLSGSQLSPTQVKNMVFEKIYEAQGKATMPEDVHFGDLASQASAQVNPIRINTIAFLLDLRRPANLLPGIHNLRLLSWNKKVPGLKRAKALSDEFLRAKYGILPTISDMHAIISAFRAHKPFFDKNGLIVHQSRSDRSKVTGIVTTSVEQHLKLALDNEDSAMDGLLSRLDSFGVLPTFENLWDLIPYSFLIDWFVDVGGFLTRIDSGNRIARLNIRYVTMSRKITSQFVGDHDEDSRIKMNLTRVHYHRWVSDHCPLPPLSLQTPLTAASHWLELTALLIQRAKAH